jgi:hypothetical protein
MTTISSPCDRCKHNRDRHCKLLDVVIAEYPPCHHWYQKTFRGKGIEFKLVTIEDLVDAHKIEVGS